METLESLKFIHFLQKNIIGSKFSRSSSLYFFFTESTSINILLLLMEYFYENKLLNIEQVHLNNTNISRPTVEKIIKDAISKNFVVKKVNFLDKRKFNLFPSKPTILEFESLIKEFSNNK